MGDFGTRTTYINVQTNLFLETLDEEDYDWIGSSQDDVIDDHGANKSFPVSQTCRKRSFAQTQFSPTSTQNKVFLHGTLFVCFFLVEANVYAKVHVDSCMLKHVCECVYLYIPLWMRFTLPYRVLKIHVF